MNALLNRIGESLYGELWHGSMEHALDVDDRTLRRWIAGKPMPYGVWCNIFVRLDAKRDEINHLIEKVKEEIDRGKK
jgi:hypothetical protein